MRMLFACLVGMIAAALSSGCTTTKAPPVQAGPVEAAPVSYMTPNQSQYAGAIWSPERHLRLYDDLRARQVGDIVTVAIVENASAKKEANTQSDRSSEIDASIDAALGWKWTAKGFVPATNSRDPASILKAKLDNKFKGTGLTDREDTMSASIACRVVQVLPSGNLYIKGSRLVQVNFEHQTITMEGIIRSSDISPSNVVLSTHVAEAKITYSGTGPVSDKQRPGWLVRVLDYVWPF